MLRNQLETNPQKNDKEYVQESESRPFQNKIIS